MKLVLKLRHAKELCRIEECIQGAVPKWALICTLAFAPGACSIVNSSSSEMHVCAATCIGPIYHRCPADHTFDLQIKAPICQLGCLYYTFT